MNKTILIFLVAVILFISGCSQVEAPQQQSTITKESKGMVKEFTITAKQWGFTPSTITVNQGDTVKITITSTDVPHGFSLPSFNINERLNPNQPVTVEFIADKVGTFTFKCNVPCGSGHNTMEGTLIVK